MSKLSWICFALFGLAIIFAIDYPALFCPFIYDDIPDLALNQQLYSDLKTAFWYNPFRGLVYLSYWVQLHLASTPSAFPFRIFNIILHWLNGFLLVKLAKIIFPENNFFSLIAGLFFWVHPLFLEAVNLVSGRFDLLVTFFTLISLSIYLFPGRSFLNALGFLLSFLMALWSKESASIIPLVALFLSAFKRERPKWLLIIISAIMIGIFIILRLNWQMVLAKPTIQLPPWHIYFLNQNWIFWLGVFKILFPFHLNFDYDLSWHFTLSIIFFLANLFLVIVLFYFILRGWKTGWLLSIYLIIYLPLFLIPLADPFRESRIYLNGAWLLILIANALFKLRENRNILVLGCLGLSLICLFSLSWKRARVWQDGQTLWRDTVLKSPQKFRPVFNYANSLRRNLELEKARRVYLWAKKLSPDNLKVEQNLSLIEQAQKNPEEIYRIKKILENNQ